MSLSQLVILVSAKYITMREASKKYGFTLSFLRSKICDGLLDSRKEYVKYKPPYHAKGSHCMRRVIVVNEDQVKKLKLWEPKKPPSGAWIRQHIRRGFTQKQMAIKYDINEHRLSKAIHELGLARSPEEVGQLRLRKDKPHVEKAKILPVVKPPKSMPEHAEMFYDTLKWVDSLNKMPTQEEIEEHIIPGFISEWLIGSMIETRPYRKLGKLEEKMTQHPVQPLEEIDGVLRFKENKIVRFLLDEGPFDMNQLAAMPFSDEDRSQFAQLIGYSLSGFGELGYVEERGYEGMSISEIHRAIDKSGDALSKMIDAEITAKMKSISDDINADMEKGAEK